VNHFKDHGALVQLRTGDWVDPGAVKLIVAGRNARPFITPDKREWQAYVRIETNQSSLNVPCVDVRGAEQFRDTFAALVNVRRGRRAPVEVSNRQNYGGREQHTNGGLKEVPAVEPAPEA
jgi:hypothetical protein